MANSWICPYCKQIATITTKDISSQIHRFDLGNKEKVELWLQTTAVVCPNFDCREYTIDASLVKTEREYEGAPLKASKRPLANWKLRPRSSAKPLPAYIPRPIVDDYEEACLVLGDSPKASATLSRRCLQGVIRDFWKISKGRLVDEINALQGQIDPSTWAAIDAVRSIGNIGAHMEKDINLIVDVEAGEAELLIQLLETLFKEWYINRHEREEQMKQIVAVANAKAAAKAPAPAQTESTTTLKP
jgi:hypothetical protein